MTVQELIDILKTQDPTEIVSIETTQGWLPIDDDWSRSHDDDCHYFCLHAYGAAGEDGEPYGRAIDENSQERDDAEREARAEAAEEQSLDYFNHYVAGDR